MFLSKLELLGFKSFATRTEFIFDGGITCVVGPNGAGKTNVLDSIRWVLGEQRTSLLRSDTMENVIFNGSKTRKPLGMAEVTMTIKNDKGILPIDYSEVSITRRVFRSGEGEYFLNKTQCRLKDIQDLLMDSGMAATAYSVIELKMVEDILRENTDERRKMFEEASGVTKYKARRKAALSKLDDVQRDLMRVNDLISEIEKKVNSLERQAKRAEQYKKFTDELSRLERQYLFAEYSLVISKIAPLRENLAESETVRTSSMNSLSQQEQLLQILRGEVEEIEKEMSVLNTQKGEEQLHLHSTEEEIAVLQERVRGLNETMLTLEKRKVELSARNEALNKQVEELLLSLAEAENEEKLSLEALSIEQTGFKDFEQVVFSAREKSNLSHENLIKIINEAAVKQNEHERISARNERVRLHLDELLNRERQLEEERINIEKRIEESNRQRDRVAEEIENEKKKLTNLERHREDLIGDLNRKTEEVRKLQERLQANSARMEFLSGLVEHLEGLPEGAKALARGEIKGAPGFDILGDLFYVAPDYRIAAESVLGEAANYLVSPDEHTALNAIELLRGNDLGKVTFVCRDKVLNVSFPSLKAAGNKLLGYVKTAPENEKLAQLFLGDVYVVDNYSEADRILREEPDAVCVSLSGDLYSSRGIIKGGSTRRTEGGRIGKRQQLEELELENLKLSRELEDAERKIEELKKGVDSLPIKTSNENLRKLELELARLEQSNVENRRILTGIENQFAEIKTRIENLKIEYSETQKELDIVNVALTEINASKSNATREYESSLESLKGVEEEYRVRNERLRSLQAEHLECINKLNFLRREIESARNQIAANIESMKEADEEIETAKKGVTDAQENLVSLETNRQERIDRLSGINNAIQELIGKLNEKKAVQDAAEAQLKQIRANHETAVEAEHQIQLKISELEAQARAIAERALEEYNLNVALETNASLEITEDFDLTSARERINYLKSRIESFGPVNLVAFSEYEEEKRRFDFITAQREDLLEAEKSLTESIDEINKTAHRKFLETFELISENFKTTFQSLFDGGEAELRLEQGVDPLEAKIEIMAKPAGKKPQSIDLLSAGEKTLTAIALLFAIYLVKPSPFCILDEVDAPLDDNNTDNYVKMLKKFSKDTQFIVITHNKRTMEAADTLYGITMEEQGVSKVVSVRFVDELDLK
ncbi:MAG: chromosome segregation protein SMC [Candidatus Kryptoniota bacterium]